MEISNNSLIQFSYDYVFPNVISTIMHPLITCRTLMMLGHEYEPPILCTTMFGTKKYVLPNIFNYMGHVRQDVGLFGMFTIGLPASLIGGTIKVAVSEHYLQKTVARYINKKSVIITDQGLEVFAKETCKLTIARCLGLIACHPFQVIMIRQIGQIIGKETIYSNITNAFIEISVNEGLPGYFGGIVPRLVGEIICVWFSAGFAYLINQYIFPDNVDPEFKQHTPMLTSACVSSCTHRFTVLSTVMAISGAGLVASIPFTNIADGYRYLSKRDAFTRGAKLFFRYTHGPM